MSEKSEAAGLAGQCRIIAIKDGQLQGDILELEDSAAASDVAEAARVYWLAKV